MEPSLSDKVFAAAMGLVALASLLGLVVMRFAPRLLSGRLFGFPSMMSRLEMFLALAVPLLVSLNTMFLTLHLLPRPVAAAIVAVAAGLATWQLVLRRRRTRNQRGAGGGADAGTADSDRAGGDEGIRKPDNT
ncbi:hypothetical protein [Pseudoxanthomonas suwonensis]|uniref:hypothetical protein n=1 Tax=Pseudoxanthomonas suwonensis TaxID=314722 RepID=UPI0004911BF5|nr:hypothetical protein [Pseudoxanthomonas suwonensis]